MTYFDRRKLNRLHLQAARLTNYLYERLARASAGSVEAERLKELVKRSNRRAKRRFTGWPEAQTT